MPTPTPVPLPPPAERSGRYTLLRRLAVGGMAEIFLARSEGLAGFEKLVVLKRILPQHAADQDFVRMILDEARLMATLNHPHIAQVYDVGVDATGHHFFTMEYVHGHDLRDMLRGDDGGARPLPIEQALGIIIAAAGGLHHAHEKRSTTGAPLGIVHRDVSPSNVLVGYDGGVKVSDFGVAKWASQRTETRAGTLKGKVGYMSPEQCRAEPIDRRSDVFALGILLYEATAGVRPFGAGGDFEILSRIVAGDLQPPSAVAPGYPPALEAIVMRALHAQPDQRFATAEAMQLALETFARAALLDVSPAARVRFMAQRFPRDVAAWHDAQHAGKSLGEHLVETLPGGPGPSPSPHASSLLAPTLTDVDAPPRRPPDAARGAPSPPWRRRLAIGAGLTVSAVLTALLVTATRGPTVVPGQAPATALPSRAVGSAPGARPAEASAPPSQTAAGAAPLPAPPARLAVTATPTASAPVTGTDDERGARPSKRAPKSKRRAAHRQTPTAPNLSSWNPDSGFPPAR